MAEVNTYTTDLVVILLDYADQTFRYTEPMWRWEAQIKLRDVGFYGHFEGETKRVIQALLIPRERWVH